MIVLFITSLDSPGSRFNGNDLAGYLNSHGHQATLLVWEKKDSRRNTKFLSSRIIRSLSHRVISKIEKAFGLQSLLYPSWVSLLFSKSFWKADVIHLQLIHDDFFSLFALPIISRLKPTFWTLHDPWAITGHCVHPMDCEQWKTECVICPHPEWPFPIRYSNVSFMFNVKKQIYEKSKLHLIVFSDWMKSMIKISPMTSQFETRVIPPGLDLTLFSPPVEKAKAKEKWGLPADHIVISFRQSSWLYKGLDFIIEALEKLPNKENIVLLTCQEQGKLKNLYQSYQVKELPMLISENDMADYYKASDIFLMPSLAESFGMMAMEAAASGVPSVVFEGTPVSEICFCNEGAGISVPQGNSKALTDAIRSLIENPQKRMEMGKLAREKSLARYSLEEHVNSHLEYYKTTLK